MSAAAIIGATADRARLPEPEHRRTLDKVRRQSRPAGGKWEGGWNKRISFLEAKRIELAARLLDERTKKPGERTGAIGLEGLKVMTLVLNMLRKHGRFDMSYDAIAAHTNVARSCVARALKRLKSAGFLDWTRRFIQTGEKGVRGPQCEQTSNLYRVSLPEAAAKLLGEKKRREPLPIEAPAPADAQSHDEARADAAARYRALDDQIRAEDNRTALDAKIERGLAQGRAKKAAASGGGNASPSKGLNP